MLTAGILLAAGHGTRFGADKLSATLFGHPLAEYAASALRMSHVGRRFCVGRAMDGFDHVHAQGEQSESLRAGIRAARQASAARAVIVLADMPLVTAGLIDSIVAACPAGGAAAAIDGRPMPPACFDAALFSQLEAARGDEGARGLLAGLPPECRIPAPGLLLDIDTREDLLRLAQTHRLAGDGSVRLERVP